jgi:hypothetical protein
MSGTDFCIPRNETAGPHYFQNKIIIFCPSPNFQILVSVSDLNISRIGLPISLQPHRQTDPNFYIFYIISEGHQKKINSLLISFRFRTVHFV